MLDSEMPSNAIFLLKLDKKQNVVRERHRKRVALREKNVFKTQLMKEAPKVATTSFFLFYNLYVL